MARCVGFFLCALLVAAGGCDSSGGGTAECTGKSWRTSTTNAVACPGADGCSCAGTACCLNGTMEDFSGSCMALASCVGAAFACDGPEDCATGDVCCANFSNDTAECKSANDCTFQPNSKAMCHSDADCAVGSCIPASSDSPYKNIIAICQ
jgi:hypothetical protein